MVAQLLGKRGVLKGVLHLSVSCFVDFRVYRLGCAVSSEALVAYIRFMSICIIGRVGQNRIYTYIVTLHLVMSKPKIPYVHRIYMVLANPIYRASRMLPCILAACQTCPPPPSVLHAMQ